MRKPVIGISPTPSTDSFSHGTLYRFCLANSYVRSVQKAGGIPVILPPGEDDIASILDLVDGLILSGGGDIAPEVYTTDAVHQATGRVDALRDAFELGLMRAAADRDVPTLAICRGIQVMNVALGGTLHQHVPDNLPNAIQHRQHEDGYSQHDATQLVAFPQPSSPFRSLLGVDELMVNSFHHQAIDQTAAPLVVAGTAADGVIEAVYHPGMRFGLGVQWHPEMLAETHPLHARLFTALVEAARLPTSV